VIPELDLICTASNDSTICIYRYPNPTEPISILKGHTSTVCALAEGNSPNVLLSGSWDKTARIWTNIESSQNAIVIEGHDAAVWAVARLASGKYATGSADKNICIWNEKGEKLVVLKGHKDCVRGLLSLPDGSLLSCSNDAVIRHWNSAYECVKEFHGHSNYIYSIARSDFWGDDIFMSASEDSTIRLWSLKEGALGGSLALPAQSVWSIAGLRNGDIITGSSDAVVRIFSMSADRFAGQEAQTAFETAVDIRIKESSKELGGVNVNE
jgi:phospholipase A-2-activating protein